MQEEQAPLIFVSYAHKDRERVELLVRRFRRRKWEVWWDPITRVGAKWEHIIDDRLARADCVVVVWTPASVKSRWVAKEARKAAERGVLMPVRLTRVEPPERFKAYEYADLGGWQGGRHQQLNRLLKDIAELITNGVAVDTKYSLEFGRNTARFGDQEARDVMAQIRAQSAMYKQNPAATTAVKRALVAIGDTYDVVSGAVNDFLRTKPGSNAAMLERYGRYVSGELVEQIQEKRGHCTELVAEYVVHGGLKDSLPPNTRKAVKALLDDLFVRFTKADVDLFDAMVAVGDGMTNESAAIVNLLTTRQRAAARERVVAAERMLSPLVRELNAGKAQLNRLAAELGIVL